jgi:sulfatase maturation enzyme AslB (radical SAM superfamily)
VGVSEGSNGIQTNGVLIDENHIRMFQQYKVQLGLSVALDGDPANSTSTLSLRL